MAKIPRGIRNNNPGNIRHSNSDWEGLAEEQTDSEYCVFTEARYGIRVIAYLLLKYERTYKLKTVKALLHRWAPPVENDTDSYVNHVAKRLGVDPEEEINVADHLEELVSVIIKHENGEQPYDPEVILEGCNMARV